MYSTNIGIHSGQQSWSWSEMSREAIAGTAQYDHHMCMCIWARVGIQGQDCSEAAWCNASWQGQKHLRFITHLVLNYFDPCCLESPAWRQGVFQKAHYWWVLPEMPGTTPTHYLRPGPLMCHVCSPVLSCLLESHPGGNLFCIALFIKSRFTNLVWFDVLYRRRWRNPPTGNPIPNTCMFGNLLMSILFWPPIGVMMH